MQKIKGRKSITTKELLKILSGASGILYDLSLDAHYKSLKNSSHFDLQAQYVPSITKRIVGQLSRKGLVEKKETAQGIVVRITTKGKREVLKFDLDGLKPKSGWWDGRWRIVFFDVEELQKSKRNMLRRCLQKLGFKQMQESVWVGPYEAEKEVKYIREILEIPHSVKLAEIVKLENDGDLRKWFNL